MFVTRILRLYPNLVFPENSQVYSLLLGLVFRFGFSSFVRALIACSRCGLKFFFRFQNIESQKKHTLAQLTLASSTVQRSAVRCGAVPCCAVLCRALLCFLFRTYQMTTLSIEIIENWREPACPRGFYTAAVLLSLLFPFIFCGPFKKITLCGYQVLSPRSYRLIAPVTLQVHPGPSGVL